MCFWCSQATAYASQDDVQAYLLANLFRMCFWCSQATAYASQDDLQAYLLANLFRMCFWCSQATAYASQDDVQAYLLANVNIAIAAVFFVFSDGPQTAHSLQGFLLQTNTTTKMFKGTYQDPNFFVQLPLQSAVQKSISRYLMLQMNTTEMTLAANSLAWNVEFTPFAHPTIATVSVIGQVLGPFVFAACMFSFVAEIGIVVSEKELGLRQALRTMGMTEMAYWLSWGAWELTLAAVSGHLITIFGLILQLDLFLHNSYGLLFFLFFLFQLAMSSLALFVSTFIKKTQIAVYIGFGIFLVGWIMQTVVIFGVPYTPTFFSDYNYAITAIFSLFPWSTLAKGVADLGSATVSSSSPGLQWSQRKSYCLNIPNTNDQFAYNPNQEYISFTCVMPLDTIYDVYIALWVGYFLLAIYFDNILPNEFNVRRPLWYPLLPSYWFPTLEGTPSLKNVGNNLNSPYIGSQDDDVAEEESKVRALLNHRTGAPNQLSQQLEDGRVASNAVEIFGLKKVFPYMPCSGTCGGLCFCCAKTSDPRAFWAIKSSWLTIAENQLFCLLGPNGAGKSTTINCLTGVLPPSEGEALVYGEAITSTSSMDRIRSMMGVCPQFDVLWGELSGIEHLQIYGSVKGIYWRHVGKEADDLLERVKLTYAGKQRTSAYSGGMKRRLSVAIALLGDPKIVYLDEPTTGMDPISRRYVWDIIQEAKVGRAIVLTTHSMEEADILGDRIAIMAKGRLRCLGTSLRLKQKFGSGYQVAVSVVPPQTNNHDDQQLILQRSDAIKAYFYERLGLHPSEEGRVYIGFLVPREQEEKLMPFLKQLEVDSARMGVTDLQISLTSLEEVFLNIAKNAEIEDARSNGNTLPVDVPLPDGTVLKVPRGVEGVLNPLDGQMYKVRWGTDESGNLCVLECRIMTPTELARWQDQNHDLQTGDGMFIPAIHAAATHAPSTLEVPIALPLGAASPSTINVLLPDGSVLRVAVNQQFVTSPVKSQLYELVWGLDKLGAPAVLSCTPINKGSAVMAGLQPGGTPANYFHIQQGGQGLGESTTPRIWEEGGPSSRNEQSQLSQTSVPGVVDVNK
ncbi:hypothetical protein CEUSTIGMA_g9382.t1 [Chlamydomonas eustigma]|uniref:ABC transporter domain-containing protein n=1 Tax=Chlamydomonas eustigma TaxID=1157962 RepID=A0A250XFV2_9CHLO|nr:hypothetical protein CEUSTIGMA_g9382.t1 [Chlamydomonas eustigma]|eukprot:GAX81954.1 hypothetical protein CEUSTIGMA_g9382.t1 [Chlamydomonas eustigma]